MTVKSFLFSETGGAALERFNSSLEAAGEKIIEKVSGLCDTDPDSFTRFGKAIGQLAVEMSKASVHGIVRGVHEKIATRLLPQGDFYDDAIERPKGKKLLVWLVHPTNYRENGEPRKWKKAILPSNAIGQLKALLPNQIIIDGEEVLIETRFLEDSVQPFDINGIKRSAEGEGVKAMVMLCGIQTNQSVRALHLAELCRTRNIPVVAGGYHVRADLPITEKEAAKYGMSLAIGEGESELEDGRPFLETILQDAWQGNLQPEYRQAANPQIRNEPFSEVIPEYQQLMINPKMTTMETSRGCPLPCSFCTIRTIGGNEVRARDPGKMKQWLRRQVGQNGIDTVFITDDNFSKSPQRFEVLEIMTELRKEGFPIKAMIQADTMATAGKEGARFAQACQDAGVYAVFLGIESVDPATLKGMNKPQNNPGRYKKMIDDWHDHNIQAQCGFILGNREDTAGVGRRSAKALLEMGVDVASASILTPLPGSVDYYRFHQAGYVAEPDFNSYDSHSRAYMKFPGGLTEQQVMQEYAEFYDEFFALANLPHLAERLNGETLIAAMRQWFWYKYAITRGDHPMYSGWGTQETDFHRSIFENSTPAVRDLAPRADGPGSPAREIKKKKDFQPVPAGLEARAL
jgi:radical SAM superfamily enzyme YgiQ (UPF0313 family)